MNILVYDVAAESGGAVTVLEYFYGLHKADKKNRYYYMLSVYDLAETENIKVINEPSIKNGWTRRLLFDFFGVQKYIKKYNIDEVLSLQNTIIPGFGGKQTVYEHNALPFTEYRFSLREDKKMWIYQNVIGKYMLWSIKKADRVIVQTEWMKEAILKRIPDAERRIEVQFPEVKILEGCIFQRSSRPIFFYPANDSKFKNHEVIIKACQILQENKESNYSVVFTLKGDENEWIRQLKKSADQMSLNISWLGNLPRNEVFNLYSKAILLFPSYIETIGLPLYEAISVGCPILVADCKYARDVTKDYKEVEFFKYDDAPRLAELMGKQIQLSRS